MLDTVRAESLSLYGYDRDTSPNLTKLAKRGVRFDQARTAAAWTLPSHASMFTGRWPYELSTRPDRPLDAAFPTLAEVPPRPGLRHGGFCRQHLFLQPLVRTRPRISPLRRRRRLPGRDLPQLGHGAGTDLEGSLRRSSPATGRTPISIARTPRRSITTCSPGSTASPKERPFFAFLNYFDAHDPYISAAGAPRHFGLRPETAQEVAALRDWLHVDKTKVPSRLLQMAIDGYDDGIAYLDDQLGTPLRGARFARASRQHADRHHVRPRRAARRTQQSTATARTSTARWLMFRSWLSGPDVSPAEDRHPAGQPPRPPIDHCRTPGLRRPVALPGPITREVLGRRARTAVARRRVSAHRDLRRAQQDPHRTTRARSLLHRGKVYIRNKDGSEELYDQEDRRRRIVQSGYIERGSAPARSLPRQDERDRRGRGGR